MRLPDKLEVTVVETTNTGTGEANDGGMKKAKVVSDNGVEHELSGVPQSVKEGERLVITLATETFHSRVKNKK